METVTIDNLKEVATALSDITIVDPLRFAV